MKEEFESINQRAVSKMLASNPEIFGSINSLDTEEMISASEEETEEEELELGEMREKFCCFQHICF